MNSPGERTGNETGLALPGSDLLITGELWYRGLIETLPVAVYTTDAQGRVTMFNAAAVDLWGRTPVVGVDEWCGSWKLYRLDGSELPLDQCPMAIALQEGRPVLGDEIIIERPDGTRRNAIAYPRPLFDESGQLTGAINTLADVTDRRRAEETGRILAAVVQSSDDAIITKDLRGIITSWNGGAERIFGYTAEEAIGQPVTMLMPPDRVNEEPSILARLRRGERIDHYETVRQRKDSSLLNISLTVSPLLNAQGQVTGASKIARDITERVRAEALQTAQRRILEMIALGTPVEEVLDALVRTIEEQSDSELLGSILLLNEDGTHLRHGAAPSLPDTYNEAINGLAIGPARGSCGTAAYRREPVYVADIASDPLWAEFRDLATAHGLRACWSTPIMSSDGEVLGTFAIYYRQVREAGDSERDLQLVDTMTRIAAIVLERHRIDTALRESEERQAYLLALSDALRPLIDPNAIQHEASRVLCEHLGAGRVVYTEMTTPGELHVVATANIAGMPSHLGMRYRVADFGPELMAELEAGRITWRDDIHAEPGLTDAERAAYAEARTIAWANAPLVKGGQLVATLAVHFPEAHDWTDVEIGLIAETAERTWDAVQRARAEQALASDLADMHHLQHISTELIHEDDTEGLYQGLIAAAKALMRADAASLQMLEPDQNRLRLLAWAGFHPESAAFWEWVSADSGSTCGAALVARRRVVAADVESAPFMAGTDDLDEYRRSGLRAVQSTPLFSRRGQLLGMISTHWRQVHEPSEREFRLLDVLARQAADLIERAQAEEAVRTSVRLKDELIGLISHEFRNPLATIIGNIGVLDRRSDLDEATRDAVIDDLRHDAGRLKRLIENMLVLSKSESSMEVVLEPVLLQRLLPRFVESEQSRDLSRPLSLAVPDDLPPVVASDAYVEQIVENLVTNARKYGAAGTPIEITAAVESEGEVSIAVLDRGDVYSDADVAAFIEPFFRSPANRDRAGGLGLGMSVCARLVEVQGGRLQIRAREGGGIAVQFTLQVLGDDEI